MKEIIYLETINLCVISNLGLNPLFVSLIDNVFTEHKIKVQISFVALEEIYETANAEIVKKADYIINWFDIEECYTFLRSIASEEIFIDYFEIHCLGILKYIRGITRCKIFCLSLTDFSRREDVYLGNLLNKFIIKCNLLLIENQKKLDLNIINLEKIILKCGYTESYCNKNYRRWNSKYSLKLYKHVAEDIYKRLLIDKGITKKCIVVDCDNVLWGGILSEDGIEGIKIGSTGKGKEFQEFQRFLLDMYYHGVILSICSKNSKADVLQILDNHPDMILKSEHFSVIKVNWNDKVSNIVEIANELNIGLDSIVFIDDSMYEIGLVASILSEVVTICYDRDTVFESLSCFNLKEYIDIECIKQRTQTYHTNIFRKDLRIQSSSIDEYLDSLQTEVLISEAKAIEYARISEISQRTNKCTNGRRYTYMDICGLPDEDKINLYIVTVKDKFCDLGTVGAIYIKNECVELFSLSCRALGRRIEERMIEFLETKGVEEIYWINTGKNDSLIDLFRMRNIKLKARSNE